MEWPISSDLQLFQSFPTKVTQNDSEWPISPDLQLYQSFPTKMAENDSGMVNFDWFTTFPIFSHWSGSEWAILPKWLKMTEQSILPDSQLFQSFPTKVAQNGQFWPIHNFANLFLLKWIIMNNFTRFTTFPIFSHWSGSEWLGMSNFAWFETFPIFSHRSGSEWLRTANFTWFTNQIGSLG